MKSNVEKEMVQTTARNWRAGTISMNSPAHGQCRTCGGNIWWGTIQFRGQNKPAWIPYSEAGHGGGGMMAMEKHDCVKHAPGAVTIHSMNVVETGLNAFSADASDLGFRAGAPIPERMATTLGNHQPFMKLAIKEDEEGAPLAWVFGQSNGILRLTIWND